MKRIVTLLLLVCLVKILFGQVATTPNGTPMNQKFGFILGYYGYKFNNPGVQVGIENYLATTKNFKIVAGAYLQFYNQNKKQTALALNIRFGQRYTTEWGITLESHIGIGVQETVYSSQLYDLTTNPITGSTVKTNKLGSLPNAAIGIGYDFSKKTNIPLTIYIRPNISWLYPDKNLVFITSTNLETGLIYLPKKKK